MNPFGNYKKKSLQKKEDTFNEKEEEEMINIWVELFELTFDFAECNSENFRKFNEKYTDDALRYIYFLQTNYDEEHFIRNN